MSSQLAVPVHWPKVIITSAKLPGRQIGRANIEFKDIGIYPRGAFDIKIDNKLLSDLAKQYGDEWAILNAAGGILHEILHQMGNTHEGDKDYSQRFFVTVAADCVLYNGTGDRIENFNLNPQAPVPVIYD